MGKIYKELDSVVLGMTLDSVVKLLQEYNKKGQLYKFDFNGVTLYSDTVTMDNAYLTVLGKTKEEFDESQRLWRERIEEEDRKHKDSVPQLTEYWIKQGKEVLTQDKWERWSEIVPIRVNDLYKGMELGQCLKLIKILNNENSFEEAKEELNNQGHSGMSYGLMKSMIAEFSGKGEEFLEYIKS